MADNSIVLELNITAKNTQRSINSVTSALKRLQIGSDKTISKLEGLVVAFRIADTDAGKFLKSLDGISSRLSNIAGSVGGAKRAITDLSNATKKVKDVAPVTGSYTTGIRESDMEVVNTTMDEAAQAAQAFSYENYKVVSSLGAVQEEMLKTSGAINPYTHYLNEGSYAGYAEVNASHGVTGAYKTQEKETRTLGNTIKSLTGHLHTNSKAFSTLVHSIGRIAFYRAIRTAIKAVTDAFRTGVSNLYEYSAALMAIGSRDSARAKETMDEFATTALYVKNSIGAAVMPVLQALVPVINAIADAFIYAVNAINQFFHALKMETMFTKAKKYTTEFGDSLVGASGAAKELKKQIFGFDELNIFNEPSSGGRGGAAPEMDFSKMFEEAEIDSVFKKIRDRIEKNLGKDFSARFTINFKDFFTKWGDLNGEDIANKILGGFYGLLGGITGFTIGGPLGAIVGTISGVALGVGIATATITPDGQLTKEEVGEMMRVVAATFTGGFVGWVVGGPGGALLGASIGASLAAIIKTFAAEPGAVLEGLTVMGFFGAVIAKMISAASGATVLKAGIGGIPMMVFGGITLSIMSLLWEHGYKDSRQAVGTAIAEAINVIAATAALGAVFGGPGGALIGMTIGVGLNLVINKIDWSNFTAESERAIEYANNKMWDGNAQAYLDFGTPVGVAPDDGASAALNRARGKAAGGIVPTGTYFYAGESGPELVGQVGPRTNVTNQDQFTAGMWDVMDATNTVIMQAAQALISAVQNIDMNPVVQIGDRQVVQAYDRGKKLAGASLVE